LDEENTVAVQEKVDEIKQNEFIPEEEKQKILSRLQRIVTKQEEVAIAEEEAKKLSSLKRIETEESEEAKAARLAKEAAAAEALRLADKY